MNKTKEYANDIMEDFIKRYPVPMNVQKAIDTLSDEDWKLYLKNKEYLRDGNKTKPEDRLKRWDNKPGKDNQREQ